jgi:hypothetical protein
MSPEDKNSQDPSVSQTQTVSQPQQTQQAQMFASKDSGHDLGIASFVISFFVGIIGLILGIIGFNKSKKAGHKNGLALAGIIIGFIQTALVIIGIVVFIVPVSGLINKCNSKLVVGDVTYTCASVNSDNPTKNSSNATSNMTSQTQLTKIAYDQTRKSGLAVKYPENWVLAHTVDESDSSSPIDTSTIISPDGKVTVTLDIGLNGIGGACDPDNTNDLLAFVDTASIPNYSDYSFVSSVIHSVSGGVYHYQVGTTMSDNISSLVVGGSVCGLGLGVISTANGNGPTAQLSVKFNDIQNDQSTTLDEFKTAITTDDYIIAKQIIQSLYMK